jgi:hypothetical protein
MDRITTESVLLRSLGLIVRMMRPSSNPVEA